MFVGTVLHGVKEKVWEVVIEVWVHVCMCVRACVLMRAASVDYYHRVC